MLREPIFKPVNDPIVGVITEADVQQIAREYEQGEDLRTVLHPYLRYTYLRDEFRAFVTAVKQAEFYRNARIREIRYVTGQPYETAQEMRQRVEESGILRISTDFNTDEFLGERGNLEFRAAHDMHHIRSEHCNFNLWGEICAYAKFASYTRIGVFRSILFSEIVAQVCVLRTTGDFPIAQKIVLHNPDIIRKVDRAYGITDY